MYDLYETKYGIFNHLDENLNKLRPLASVAMHDSEDINLDCLLEQTIKTYVKRGIKDIFGLNINEFLNLPMDIAEMLIIISNEEKKNKADILSKVERDLDNFK